MNRCAKGKVGEREAAALMREIGFTARRGQQHKGSPDSPDVIVDELPNVHIEVKRDERVKFGRKEFEAAWEQAETDRGDHQAPALLWRGNGQVWRLTFEAEAPCLRLTVFGSDDIRHALLWLNARSVRMERR